MAIEIRLQKFMADNGVAARRKCEKIILEGRVTVNDEVVTVLGTKINPQQDVVLVDGNCLSQEKAEHLYLIVNKPRAVITSVSDPEGRKTVMDLIPSFAQRIFPVGRLDYLSEGLLILTNDGHLANLILHPRFELEKVYEVKIFGKLTEGILKKLKAGVMAEDGLLKPKSVRVIEDLPNKTWVEFRLQEGKNREIRRLCEHCGLTIDKLRRVAIGGLTVQGLAPGNFDFLSKNELLDLIGIDETGRKIADQKFTSEKRTIFVRNKNFAGNRADDKHFYRYRKEHYLNTLDFYKKQQEEERLAEEKKKAPTRRIIEKKKNPLLNQLS